MPRRVALAAAPDVLRAGNGESPSEDARPLAGATTETERWPRIRAGPP